MRSVANENSKSSAWSSLDWIFIFGLILIQAIAWMYVFRKFSFSQWSVPINYTGDTWAGLAILKSVSEGHYIPFWHAGLARVGAPGLSDFSEFPIVEQVLLLWGGILARVFGLIQGFNAYSLSALLSTTVSFFCVARSFKLNRNFSALCSLFFGFSAYMVYRSQLHFMLAFTFSVPFSIFLAYRLSQIRWDQLRIGKLFFLGAFVVGFFNVYYINFFFWLLFSGAVIRLKECEGSLKLCWREAIVIPFLAVASSLTGFLISLTYYWRFRATNSLNPFAVQRSYSEVEIGAMKPIDLLIPPDWHRFGPLAKIAQFFHKSGFVQSEMGSQYVGVIGIAGLLFLLWNLIRSRTLADHRRLISFSIVSVFVLFAYTVVGGVNGWLGLTGLYFFRSTNRVSIFIHAFALLALLVFLTEWWDRLSAQEKKTRALLAFAILFCIGVYDQYPRRSTPEQFAGLSAELGSDRLFAENLEAALPHDAMVFQLPVVPFPEEAPRNELLDYEHFRPYLFSRTLRWTYGAIRGRESFDWQKRTGEMPTEDFLSEILSKGFSSVLVARKGFTDKGDSLLTKLKGSSHFSGRELVSPDGEFTALLIK